MFCEVNKIYKERYIIKMLINWVCLICIVAMVFQIMFFFYMSALSDLKPKRHIKRVKRVRKQEYNYQKSYADKIAK
ncbi:hypothetical protein SAMN02744040_02104 [Tepidibacter thalassicus DSM 15285]|uniref:Uncharacterized protein n=1 Tax=Tepidibacter thalassicus DSM 15285 TaxID=1123350 RepID=A0A1M5TBI2_9FIRM|nr:hypothetical protein SAMN02744040_02104 [Tepidibacter thalassicus DSM 15285]